LQTVEEVLPKERPREKGYHYFRLFGKEYKLSRLTGDLLFKKGPPAAGI
jgi:hypothetical protein